MMKKTLQNGTSEHLHWSNILNCSIVFSYVSLNDFTAQHLESKKVLGGYGLKLAL